MTQASGCPRKQNVPECSSSSASPAWGPPNAPGGGAALPSVRGLPLQEASGGVAWAGRPAVLSAESPCPSALLWGLSCFSQECSSDKELRGMQALQVTQDLYHVVGKGRCTTQTTQRETRKKRQELMELNHKKRMCQWCLLQNTFDLELQTTIYFPALLLLLE